MSVIFSLWQAWVQETLALFWNVKCVATLLTHLPYSSSMSTLTWKWGFQQRGAPRLARAVLLPLSSKTRKRGSMMPPCPDPTLPAQEPMAALPLKAAAPSTNSTSKRSHVQTMKMIQRKKNRWAVLKEMLWRQAHLSLLHLRALQWWRLRLSRPVPPQVPVQHILEQGVRFYLEGRCSYRSTCSILRLP